jgi:rubrerythrin
MTNSEAIDTLQANYPDACFEQLRDAVDTAIHALSVQSERKKGKWINRSLNIRYPEWERYTCSVCGKHSNNYDFCPHCGADMRGRQDE